MNLLGLTGLKYLEIDTFKPDQYKEPIELDFTPRYKVIPTYSSDIKEIGAALENIFQKLKALDIERMSNHLLRVSSKLDKILSDSKVDSIGAARVRGHPRNQGSFKENQRRPCKSSTRKVYNQNL